jgi:hypothetical protein
MLTVINFLPLYFWVPWGTFGTFYILRWVIRATKEDPVMWRVGWIMGAVLNIIAMTDNLIQDKVVYFEWWTIVDQLSIPLALLMVTLLYIGGYQKAMHPGYDLEKRRTFILCSYILVVTFVFLGLFLGGLYIYDNFFK